MFCPHCSEEIAAQAEICPKCGVRVQNTSSEDRPNIAINILSFCCTPLLGIIMYFVWKDNKPKAAKSALIWALIVIGVYVVVMVVSGIIGFVLGSIEESNY
ncbi:MULTISPECIES: zinc-ribbon domain-containing protein [unclassified Lysinibacillus]|uniref:zinc-ribbon domain-containing protein n=1 Tax=unclassified Lysinibacillus TaxID=2636778 RepID=UPI0025528226|nr:MULTISPECIES: zinc-ribbon domain-containing protein [unclassified Lysinibacillus]MDM5247434.1 zinc-ribbon domain-containing protein [Lysinibacillus sp. G4S2]